ncbi:LysR family transcriptional regulator [Pseudomonas aeruginosa P49]|nr:LysR family transcriptional regulator [Pseudomonas aeruginosa P47]OPF28781.1 LysR family transcriptional regulator [Pseudomonas aeruginosa P37]OPF29494.1 LysR family transcriptional regulator [Pseudomonas aeruginosa SD9]OPF44971.1 LysR family transcriptional regulator [Pseudomonas aeruginosa P49]
MPRDLQIDWLKCFVAAVDSGSLSSAAIEVHRSQSAVSMQLKKLEAALGRQVLRRSPRQLELTEDGQALLGYARRMLALHAETQAAFAEETLTGRIRLGVAEDYAAHYLTPVLRRFAPRHGGVDIELTCEQSTALIPRVASGDLDLALVSRDGPTRGLPLPGADGLGRRVAVRTVAARPAAHCRLRGGQPGASLRGQRAWRAGAAVQGGLQQFEPGRPDRGGGKRHRGRGADALQRAGALAGTGTGTWAGAVAADGRRGLSKQGVAHFQGRGQPAQLPDQDARFARAGLIP